MRSNVISIRSGNYLSPCCRKDSKAILLQAKAHHMKCGGCGKLWVRHLEPQSTAEAVGTGTK